MTIVKLSKQYLVAEDDGSITVDLPESLLKQLQKDYQKVEQARGLLKDRKAAMLTHLSEVRQEWEQ